MSNPPVPPIAPKFSYPRKRSKTRAIVVGSVLMVIGVLVLWSCGKGAYHNYFLARSAVEQFHRELDQGDYDSIYENATDAFRAAGTHGDQVKFLEMVHQKMGNSGKMSPQGFHVNWNNNQVVVDQVYSTKFALGEAQESFVWVIEKDRPRLHSYRIDSPNLR